MPQAFKHGETYLTPEGGHAVSLTNSTGSVSVKGQVVRAASSSSFSTCEVDETPIGVVYESGVANGKKCLVVVSGRAQVLLKNSVSSSANDWLYTTDTAGRATSTADSPGDLFTPAITSLDVLGRSVQTVVGGTDVLVWAVLHVQNSIGSHGGTPGAHASSHENGGSDEIDVGGLSGLLADAQTPLGHATTHASGQADAIKIDDLAPPDDNADLNASVDAHGLLPKLHGNSEYFLNGLGFWVLVQGNTLDEAYDQGGAGAGREITVDSNPVYLDGSGGSVIELAGHATFQEINTPGAQTYKGALYSKRVSGDSERTELFYLDNAGNETQLTDDGADPFADVDTQNTLDQAYDEGGAGAGSDITVDSGPVYLDGSGGSVIELNGHATFREITTPSSQTYKGALYSKRVSGDAEVTELFYLDNQGTETQLTSDGADPFEAGNTLDQAYDEGGAGAGRTITVDSSPVYLDASGNEALDVNGYVDLREISAPANTANMGKLYVKNQSDGETDISELFYLDDQGAETQLTKSGADPFSIGGSLDDAYDYGAMGGDGRSITVDNGPVYLNASGGEGLDINGYITLQEISAPGNNTDEGRLYCRNVAGDTDTTELFFHGDGDVEVQITNAGLLAKSFLPGHADTHASGEADVIQLDDLGVPSDTVYLNSTIAAHGLLPKLDGDSSHYLNGTGAWTTPAGGGTGTVDRFLVFADDYEFTETGGAFVTKKAARIVLDSDLSVTGWRVVVSTWITGGGGDTAEVKVDIGGDSVTLTSTSLTEEIKAGDITVSAASEDTLEDLVIQLKVTGAGGDTAHVKYTDIYAVYE